MRSRDELAALPSVDEIADRLVGREASIPAALDVWKRENRVTLAELGAALGVTESAISTALSRRRRHDGELAVQIRSLIGYDQEEKVKNLAPGS